MPPVHINIHPDNQTWEKIKISLYSEGSGNCLNIDLDEHMISLHYGLNQNKKEFIEQFFKQIAKIYTMENL